MTVKCLILFTFFHLELVWLVYNCFLFIMFIYKYLLLINEWTNLEFCTSFAIRQQWLPPGVTNCMVFNFKPVLYLKVVENYHITCHTNRQIFLVSLSTLCSHNWVAAIVISAFGCHLTNLTLMTLICLSVYCLFYDVGIFLREN